MNQQLAEICGIHAGDGYLRIGKRTEWDISGHIEEQGYYDNHIIPLFNSVFNLSISGKYFKGRNTYGFVIRSKEVIYFANKKLGFPNGAKSLIVKTPKCVFSSKKLMRAFLRGYFDTDGCLAFKSADKKLNYSNWKKNYRYYPKIQLVTVSEKLFGDLQIMLKMLNFTYSIYSFEPKIKTNNIKYIIFLNGKKNVLKWFKEIGSSNPLKQMSYEIWCKFGHCPANLNLEMKRNILKGQVNPEDICGPVA